MAESDIFVSNDIALDVNFGEVFVVDSGVVYKVIASKYSSTETYVVGAYVLHLEKLYRCITAVSEPEEFDAEKWTQVLLADEVQIANANIALKADADSVYDKSAVDNALALKANVSDVYAKTDTYNKTEVDNALATKADANTTYSKTEVDNALALKADSNSVYSKSDTDTLLAMKADTATTYTKTEVDTALENKANSADVYAKTETYSKAEIDTNIYTKSETYTKTEVDTLISNLPEPMIFKGTLGVNGTITELPTASASNEGYTYKVITAGTYAEQVAKVGDVFVSNGSAWVLIPAGDEDSDTWRAIKVNGVEKLGNAISSGSVDFVDTPNVKFEFDSNGNAVKATLNGIDTSSEVDAKVAGLIDDESTTNNKAWSSEKISTELAALLPVDEVSGAIANFDTDVVLPLIDVKAEIKAVETGTGAKSPSNPYVLSGFTGANLYQRGANLWDGQYEAGTYDQTTGEATPSTSLKRNITPIAVKPNTNYARVKTQEEASLLACRMFYYDANMTLISTRVDAADRAIITTPNNCAFVNFAFQNNITALSFNYPSSDTEMHAYNPNSSVFPVSWQTEAGEVFGGYFDFTTGKLVVTHGLFEFDGSNDEEWNKYTVNTDQTMWRTSIPERKRGVISQTGSISSICNRFELAANTSTGRIQGKYSGDLTYFDVIYNDVSDLTAWRTWLANNPIQLAVELATPVEYDLTPQQILPFLGINNIWSDTNGDSTVKYKVGIQKYIDKKIAEVQALVL